MLWLAQTGRIAKIVGYADASRFGVHFRHRYGFVPRAYRRQFGGGRWLNRPQRGRARSLAAAQDPSLHM